MIEGKDLFDFSHSLAGERLQCAKTPWEALAQISAWICEIGAALDPVEYEERSPQVWVHRSAHIAPTAYLGAPCIVGPETEVRHCAFVRGSALIGAGCVVGNSTEIKNAILFDHVQVPHYNYIGDSILGYGAPSPRMSGRISVRSSCMASRGTWRRAAKRSARSSATAWKSAATAS